MLAKIVFQRRVVSNLGDRHGLDELDHLRPIQFLASLRKLSGGILFALEIKRMNLKGHRYGDFNSAVHIVHEFLDHHIVKRDLEIHRQSGGIFQDQPHQIESADAIRLVNARRAPGLAGDAEFALDLRRARVVGDRNDVGLPRARIVRDDGLRADIGAFGDRRLVRFAVTKKQKVDPPFIQLPVYAFVITRIASGAAVAAFLRLAREWLGENIEKRFLFLDDWRGGCCDGRWSLYGGEGWRKSWRESWCSWRRSRD